MKKRKILYISGTRADYGLMKETLLSIRKNPELKIEIAATGMHLMPEFGRTINEIKKDGFKIHKIEATYERDNKESMAKFVGGAITLLVKEMKKIKPDIILILGDRGEMLSGAIAGAYLAIPVAHIHGGEVTSTVDEFSRHATTKLAHLHFVTTKNSAERIRKLGEDIWRVFIVGAPGLDDILNKKLFSKKEIAGKCNLNLKEPVLLVIQHPSGSEIKKAGRQMRETMEAIKELGFQTVVIYPNADAGGREMIKIIEEYRKYSFIKIFKSLPRKDYLGVMSIASVMVGNSSSGIIEAPSFHLPMINVGKREKGRERVKNVINVDYKKDEIKKAIQKAIYNKKFRERVKKCKNPYGDGKTGPRIAKILARVKIDKKLLEKQITY